MTLNIITIKHQLKAGQTTFSDKTVRLLIAEIERLQQQAAQLPLTAAPPAAGDGR